MISFADRLAKRLSAESRIKRGKVSEANIATPKSIATLRGEITAKVIVNEAMCGRSLRLAEKTPLV